MRVVKPWGIGLVFTAALLLGRGLVHGEGLLFDKAEYAARRARLMAQIPDGIAVIRGVGHATGFIEHVQNNDFAYLTGVEAPGAWLILDGTSKRSLIFYTLTEREARAEGLSPELASKPERFTGIDRHDPVERFSAVLARLCDRIGKVYTPFLPEELARECAQEKMGAIRRDRLQDEWDGRLTRELQFVRNLRMRFPQIEVVDLWPILRDLRIIKTTAEIEWLRKVGRIGAAAHTEMIRTTRSGMWEYEVASVFDFMCRLSGARDMAYNIIISTADRHPFLHYYRHDRKLTADDFLVVDAGPDLGHYDVDITVSYPADGRFTPRQREIYQACWNIHQACYRHYRPGLTSREIGARAKRDLIEAGIDLSGDAYLAMMRHLENGGVSHYVGMAVHDVGGAPRGPLRPGMVIALDIYAVFPDEDLGVRIEDTVLITEDGCENLTPGLPREIREIEALMKQEGILQRIDR